MKQRITAQVLNGATGEVREVVANVAADTVQDAVDKLFSHARKDDYYYRILCCMVRVIPLGPNMFDSHALVIQHRRRSD